MSKTKSFSTDNKWVFISIKMKRKYSLILSLFDFQMENDQLDTLVEALQAQFTQRWLLRHIFPTWAHPLHCLVTPCTTEKVKVLLQSACVLRWQVGWVQQPTEYTVVPSTWHFQPGKWTIIHVLYLCIHDFMFFNIQEYWVLGGNDHFYFGLNMVSHNWSLLL